MKNFIMNYIKNDLAEELMVFGVFMIIMAFILAIVAFPVFRFFFFLSLFIGFVFNR